MFGWNHFVHSWPAPENVSIEILVPPQFRYDCEAFHKCFKWCQSRRSSCGPPCESTSPDGNTSPLHVLHQPLHRNGGTISASRCHADSIMFTNLTHLSDTMLRLLVLLCEMVLRWYRIFWQHLLFRNATVFCADGPRWPARINITFYLECNFKDNLCRSLYDLTYIHTRESHVPHVRFYKHRLLFLFFLLRFLSARKLFCCFFCATWSLKAVVDARQMEPKLG